jgi:large subunit ribosomal protein L21
MTYAIISLGGKQYRVREGEKLLVDRLKADEGATFQPSVLMLGGDGGADLAPSGSPVTARVVGHVLGPKVRIGKYKPKSGYRKHAGHRSRLSQIQIESIGGAKKTRSAAKPKAEKPSEEAPTVIEARTASADLPEGYGDMTISDLKAAIPGWSASELAAALAYEQEHGKRKGALAALESAAGKEGDS